MKLGGKMGRGPRKNLLLILLQIQIRNRSQAFKETVGPRDNMEVTFYHLQVCFYAATLCKKPDKDPVNVWMRFRFRFWTFLHLCLFASSSK